MTAAAASPRVSPPSAVTPETSYPAETEEYYVGMIPDAEDARFAYRPGTLVVERRPARLRLAGDEVQVAPVFHRGPITTARMADDHPAPTAEELASLAVRSRRVIVALGEENLQLKARLAATSSPPVSPVTTTEDEEDTPSENPRPSAMPAGAATASAENTETAADSFDNFSLVRPNADNVIELDPALFSAPAAAGQNPFVQVYQPAPQWRELTLLISAAVPGPNPSVVINDTPYGLHSQIQDLEVYRIEADVVYLRKATFLLICPVSEKPLHLRLP